MKNFIFHIVRFSRCLLHYTKPPERVGFVPNSQVCISFLPRFSIPTFRHFKFDSFGRALRQAPLMTDQPRIESEEDLHDPTLGSKRLQPINIQVTPNCTIKYDFEIPPHQLANSEAIITIFIGNMTTCTTTQTESEINLNTLDAIELQDLSQNSRQGSTKGLKLGDLEDVRGEAAPPSTAVEAKQKWNEPAINRWRVLATFWSFFVTGMNDGSYGVSFR